jgi:flavin-binding protein dodecin
MGYRTRAPSILNSGSRISVPGGIMFRVLEIDGTSDIGFSEAVHDSIEKLLAAGEKVSYFQVIEQRGAVRDGKFKEFQVKLKVAVEAVLETPDIVP